MSKFTRLSAALALVLALVSSGCKSNNQCCGTGGGMGDGCGCGGAGGGAVSGIPAGGTAISTTPAPAGMMGTSQSIGSQMPTGSSYTPSSSRSIMGGGMGGSSFGGASR